MPLLLIQKQIKLYKFIADTKKADSAFFIYIKKIKKSA